MEILISPSHSEHSGGLLTTGCCITENVSVQLYTWNCHQSPSTTSKSLSAQTFSPTSGSSQAIRIYLDTGDTRRGGIRTRAPHYDTLKRRTPLSDITNRSTNQVSSTQTRISRAMLDSLSTDRQLLVLNDNSYDASNRIEFVKDLERIESSEDFDPDECGAEVSLVSNGSTLVSSSTQNCGFPMCEIALTSRMRNLEKETKYWCSLHKWCSKYELAGKCGYSIQIGRKNNAKVRL